MHGGCPFLPALTNIFPTLNADQQRAMENFRAAINQPLLFAGGTGGGIPTLPAVSDTGGSGLGTSGTTSLTLDPFAQAPEGFTPSGSSDLVSGLTAPSGADSSTTLGSNTSDLGGMGDPTTTLDNVTNPGELSESTFTAAQSTSFYNAIINDIIDFFIRGGVFIVGAVMLAAAAYAFTRESK